MMRVLIADPDPKSRNALFLWLTYKFGVDEIIQVSDGGRLREQLEHDIPNLILMDWSLPDRPTAEFCQEIQEKIPTLRWVILSVDADISGQVDASSWLFLQKGSPPDEVFLTLQKSLGIEAQ